MKINKLFLKLGLVFTIVITGGLITSVFGQISAPGATDSFVTEYFDDNGPWSAGEQDSVFLFCADNANGGALMAPDAVGCTYQWYEYDDVSYTFVLRAETTQSLTNIPTGGYRVVVTCGGTSTCYDAWVYVNVTNLSVYISGTDGTNYGDQMIGCDMPFEIHGNADPVSNMTVYNPPANNFVIGPNTEIEVCFTADHTWVSDLGFYLVAPGYGTCMGCSPSVPGQTGTVELLPSVAAWDDGVTDLPSSVYGCSNSFDIGDNCNQGDDVLNFCFTTELPAGNPANVPCVCDLPTPLTGTYASAGPWDYIFGSYAAHTDPNTTGWAVQIYDCIGADVGHLTEASITFKDVGQCGEAIIEYNSGPISSSINDESCSYDIASIYVVPPTIPYQYDIDNYIVSQGWYLDNQVLGSSLVKDSIFDLPNEIPIYTTTYVYRAVDNLGCEKIDSVTYINVPDDATIAPGDTSVCTWTNPIVMQAPVDGGQWTINGTPANSIFDPSDPDYIIGPAGNEIIYSIGAPCPASDTIIIQIGESPSVSNIVADCGGSADSIVVTFEYTGGIAPYTIIDQNTGTFNGDTLNNVFTSNPMYNGNYNFTVNNTDGCGTATVEGALWCNCSTFAGSMDLNPITVCGSDVMVGIHLNNENFDADSNDVLGFIIHNGSGSFPYDAIAYNPNEPVFYPADLGTAFHYDSIYYISAVAGNENLVNGQADTADVCYSQSMGVSVRWKQPPTADIPLTTMSVCGKTVNLVANSSPVGQGVWSCADCGQFLTTNNSSVNDTSVWITLFDDYGTNQFVWTVYNGACTDTDYVYVTFTEKPIAFAGLDKEVCGKNVTMEADFGSGTSGYWRPSLFGDFAYEDSSNTSITAFDYGTYSFTWVALNGLETDGCFSEDYVSITFLPAPVLDLGPDQVICGASFTLNAGSSGLPEDIRAGQWVWEAGSLSFIINSTDPIQNITVGGLVDSASAEFIWNEHNTDYPMCTDSDTMRVTFFSLPTANAGPDAEICGNSYHLQADTVGAGLFTDISWSTTYPIAFDSTDCPIDQLGASSEVGKHDPAAWATLTSNGLYGNNYYAAIPIYLAVANGDCKVVDEIVITFNQKPIAFAGFDTVVCGLTHIMGAIRSLDSADASTWTHYDGPAGSSVVWNPDPAKADNNMVTATDFNNGALGDYYTFIWTEKNPHLLTCKSSDTVKVSFLEPPNVDAGVDFKACGKTTQLNAIPSSGLVGNWVPNGASFSNPASNTSNVTVNVYGPMIFTWVENNQFCAGYDTVVVTFYEDVIATHQVDIPASGIVPNCGPEFTELQAMDNYSNTNSDYIEVYWTDELGDNTSTFYNPGQPDDTVSVEGQYMGVVHNFYWVVVNGRHINNQPVCIDSSDVVPVMFYPRPTPYAGEDFTACGFSTLLHATPSNDSVFGRWISANPTNTTFHYNGLVRDTLPTDSVTVDEATYNQNPNFINLIWFEDSGYDLPGFTCSNKDTVKVIFAERPTAKFYYKAPPCYGDSAKIWADITDPAIFDVETALFTWSYGDGVDGYNYGDTIGGFGPGPHMITWDPDFDGSGSSTFILEDDTLMHIVELRVKNEFGCESIKYKDTIYEPLDVPWDSLLTITSATCSDFNGSIQLDTWSNTYTYEWLDGRITNPAALSVSGLEGGDNGYYDLMVEYDPDRSIYPEPFPACTTLYTVYLPDTGEVTAMFDTTIFVIGLDGLALYDSIVDADIQFTDRSTESARKWSWKFYNELGQQVTVYDLNGAKDIDESIDENPYIRFSEPGYYSVRLVVTSKEGCDDVYEFMSIFVKGESSIEVPNIFTPNGDGANDIFKPATPSMEFVHGFIFDRWGRKIYEWTWEKGDDEDLNGWDGMVKGKEASPGVYFYMIEAEGQDGETYQPSNCPDCRGTVHLVRSK